MSLQRRDLTAFGNDPINWIAAFPPGTTAPDTDTDGMADWWETANGLVVGANDAALDPDLDGMTNLQEFLAGTDPHNAVSALRLTAALLPNGVWLSFEAQADLGYTVQTSLGLTPASWQAWQQVPASVTSRTVNLTNVSPLSQQRFFRVVTPQGP
jgi:hypothetical protein